jgi:hypothetical protein
VIDLILSSGVAFFEGAIRYYGEGRRFRPNDVVIRQISFSNL